MRRLETRTVLAIATTFLALPTAGAAGVGELWRGPADASPCHLELVNELGGVRVMTAPEAPTVEGLPVAAVTGGAGLAIEASAAAEPTRLMVSRIGPQDEPAADDVVLIVPSGCEVAVRTNGGAVHLEVDRESMPATVDTVTGDIIARIDPNTDATVVFATSGEITTDFGVEIDFRYHSEPAKHGWVALGAEPPDDSGSKKVRLTTRRGAVRLLRPTTTDTALPVETRHGRPEDP